MEENSISIFKMSGFGFKDVSNGPEIKVNQLKGVLNLSISMWTWKIIG
jgi:hypothetical protein